jgi:hypothetical protein
MKHLKKLAALLLVGVLALSLLTACGGGGSTSADAQAETAVMAAINQNRPVNSAKLQNSSELRKIANQDLDAAISGKWGQLSSSFTFKSHTDLKNGKFGYTFIAKCDYKNTDLAKLIKTDTNINSHYMDKWSDVGVVVRTDKDNGQTYIAISVAIDTSKT